MSLNDRSKSVVTTLLGTVALSCVVAAPAVAQENAPQDSDEIIVTASKRETTLQRTPLAVSALGPEQLADLQIMEPRDLNGRVPGLTVFSTGGRTAPLLFIRGVGAVNFTPESSSPVGQYQDEVYQNTGMIQSEPYFDIERIEVVRGPQGTLFGKNTTAGAINVITRRPSDVVDGYATLTYGTFNEINAEGAVGGPLIENVLAGRFAFTRLARDAFIDNEFDGSGLGDYADAAFRAQLLWTPNDSTSYLLKLHGREMSGSSATYRHVGFYPGGVDAFGYSHSQDAESTNANVTEQPMTASGRGATVIGEHDLGIGQLILIGAYDEASSTTQYDDDGGPVEVERSRYPRATEQTSIEARLVSDDTGFLSWIAGYHYFNEDLSSDFRYVSLGDVSYPYPFGVAGDYTQETESHAVYASATLQLAPQWSLVMGARYTSTEKAGDLFAQYYDPDPASPWDPALSLSPTFTSADWTASESWNEPTGDITLQFDATDDINLYARAARGFREGSFNGVAYSDPTPQMVDPEIIVAYEVGAKTRWFDNRLTVNLAAYQYEYTDQQVYQFIGTASTLTNAGEGTYSGVDLELVYSPTPNLDIGVTAAWMDPTVSGFTQLGPDGNSYAIEDTLPAFTPEQTATFNLDYSVPLSIGEIRFHTDWSYRSRVLFNPVQLPDPVYDVLEDPEHWKGNVRVTWAPADSFEISLWGRNVTDEQNREVGYVLSSTNPADFYGALGIGGVLIADPATYGVTITARF